MGITKVKRAIILFLIIGTLAVVSGCARWPEPEPEPHEPEYQLEITVEVAGGINADEGMYYVVLDNDGNSATGPGDDISSWDDNYYYIKLDNWGFYFTEVEEGSPDLQLTDSSYSGDKLKITIALSDLENPSSIDINVITTDSENNTYDHLDSYFTISTVLGSAETSEDSTGDSGDGGVDFDIIKVTAVVTTLY